MSDRELFANTIVLYRDVLEGDGTEIIAEVAKRDAWLRRDGFNLTIEMDDQTPIVLPGGTVDGWGLALNGQMRWCQPFPHKTGNSEDATVTIPSMPADA